jgi:hypothetical protein
MSFKLQASPIALGRWGTLSFSVARGFPMRGVNEYFHQQEQMQAGFTGSDPSGFAG